MILGVFCVLAGLFMFARNLKTAGTICTFAGIVVLFGVVVSDIVSRVAGLS